MMTEPWRGFRISGSSTRSSPPKRSFDVAFLTGAKDILSEGTSADDSKTVPKVPKRASPPSSPSTAVETHPKESVKEAYLGSEGRTSSRSAFTKVFKSQVSPSSTSSQSSTFNIASSLSSVSWPPSPAPLHAMTSLLSNSKTFSPLMVGSPFLPPALVPLLSHSTLSSSDSLNNNLVEEYLKTRHEFLTAKSSSATEALSRLRSSMLPPADPYKFPFATFPYSVGARTPSKSHFLSQNSVSSLIPPSLATLTLPAQNICAKCNISFRMTSDLVYHMRSQHKRETDPYVKRRNEKLKCPICQESFRERHHLTRHMTAHQDRAEEAAEANKQGCSGAGACRSAAPAPLQVDIETG